MIDDPDNQRAVLEFGFRPGNPAVAIGDPINTANGLNPGKPDTEFATPTPEVLSALIDNWETNRKTARVIILLDVSGSMADLAGDGFSKLELAKEAVITSFDEFKPEDEIGLWVFSTNLDGDQDYLELIPPAPLASIRDELEARSRTSGRGRHRPLRLDHGRGSGRQGQASTRPRSTRCCSSPTGCAMTIPRLRTRSAGAVPGSNERDVVRVFPVAYGQDAVDQRVDCHRQCLPGPPLSGHQPFDHPGGFPTGDLELLTR